MKIPTYQQKILKIMCIIAALSEGVYARIPMIERLEDGIQHFTRQVSHHFQELFNHEDPWEALPERLETIATEHLEGLVRDFNALPDLIVERTDNFLSRIERKIRRKPLFHR